MRYGGMPVSEESWESCCGPVILQHFCLQLKKTKDTPY